MISIVCYCPRCDYFAKATVEAGAVGTHGCTDCDGLMEVFVAQGSREVVKWHSALSTQEESVQVHVRRDDGPDDTYLVRRASQEAPKA